MAEQLRLRASAMTGGHRVTVSGEIDIATAPCLAESLVRFTEGDVVVDLSQVTFIDGAGLRALIAAQRQIERRNGRLIVEDTSAIVRRLFEIAGIDSILDISTPVSEAG